MNELREMYLDLVKKSLTNYIYGQEFKLTIRDTIHGKQKETPNYKDFNYEWLSGRYPRGIAQTMIGIWRLDNIRGSRRSRRNRGMARWGNHLHAGHSCSMGCDG